MNFEVQGGGESFKAIVTFLSNYIEYLLKWWNVTRNFIDLLKIFVLEYLLTPMIIYVHFVT